MEEPSSTHSQTPMQLACDQQKKNQIGHHARPRRASATAPLRTRVGLLNVLFKVERAPLNPALRVRLTRMQVDGLVTVTAQPHTPALVPVICPPECRSCFLANMYRSSLSVKAFSLSLFCNYRSSLVVPATHLYVDSSHRLASSHVYMCGSPPQGADTVYVHFSWRIEVQKSAHAHMEARACELALHVQDRQIDTGMHMLWELW